MIDSNDHFQEAYEEFRNSKLAERLEKKYQIQPFYKRFALLNLLSRGFSYLFNGLSVASAFALVFFFISTLIHVYVAASITAILFALMEIGKRKSSSLLFKDRLQFHRINKIALGFVLILSAASIVFSYFGAKQIVRKLTPPTRQVVIADTLPEVKALASLIDSTRQAIIANEGKKNHKGQTLYNIEQHVNPQLKMALADYEKDLIALRMEIRRQNLSIEARHEMYTFASADNFAIIALICEFLFLLCVYFCELYDYRSLAEFESGQKQKKSKDKKPRQKNRTDVQKLDTSHVNRTIPSVDLSIRKDAKENIRKLRNVYDKLRTEGVKINKTVLAKKAGVSTKTVQRYYDQIAV